MHLDDERVVYLLQYPSLCEDLLHFVVQLQLVLAKDLHRKHLA